MDWTTIKDAVINSLLCFRLDQISCWSTSVVGEQFMNSLELQIHVELA
jgi:hypothetical protein